MKIKNEGLIDGLAAIWRINAEDDRSIYYSTTKGSRLSVQMLPCKSNCDYC